MRLGQAIFFGAAAGLLTLAAPTLARNSSANSHTAKAIGCINWLETWTAPSLRLESAIAPTNSKNWVARRIV
jgi:hypothetical protein